MRRLIAVALAAGVFAGAPTDADARCRTTACWHKVHRARAERWYSRELGCGTPACNQRLGVHMARKRWNRVQAECLRRLGARESGWDERKWNRQGSGAYGIPQALPGSKMGSHGRDWATNPETQIRWMLDYVRGRYGSACAANYAQLAQGWY